MTDLTDQVAVVTGASRGIGRRIARDLAAAGATVCATARTVAGLEETADLVATDGGTCHVFPLDVGSTDDVATTMARIEDEVGPIDVLVNNAGITGAGPMPWEQTVEDWWRVMEVNVRGPWACAHAVVPGMRSRGRGRIVNVGSEAAVQAAPDGSAYAASKAALLSLTASLGAALAQDEIAVFAVSPGLVLTDMTRGVDRFAGLPDDAWTPIERIGVLCVALASGKADALSGRYLHASADDLDDLLARADEVQDEGLHTLRVIR